MQEMIFKGQVLTPEQIAALANVTLEAPNLSAKAFHKFIDRTLKDAGLPVPDIEEGQVVTWTIGFEQDKGRVVSYDERADKYRVTSKLKKRDFTVAARDIRIVPVKEKVSVQAD